MCFTKKVPKFQWRSDYKPSPILTHTHTQKWHVCLRTILFQRWILYVDNNLVISLGAAAEHTHLCNDKRKGLASPLRIPHKHSSDKPNFAQGTLYLLENQSNKFANMFKNSHFSHFSEPIATIYISAEAHHYPSRILGVIVQLCLCYTRVCVFIYL